MLLPENIWVFLGFILCISGDLREGGRICVFKGSSVNLTCSNASSTASLIWYTVTKNDSMFILEELPADGNYVTRHAAEDNNSTLTIVKVRERDGTVYCCQENTENPDACWNKGTELQIADVQVKVIPASEEQKVTLMCTTSCSLTESPAGFIWYQNSEFLYEDWSPWYQELVSSEDSVRYSCAVKGSEQLRAPDVSVASITPACFTVTYAKGHMCSQQSMDKPCSITYPTDVYMQQIPGENFVTLTCNTSCPAADPHTAFRWYWNRMLFDTCESQYLTVFQLFAHITCGVKNNQYLISDETCSNTNCDGANYINKRICMPEGSSVNMSIVYLDKYPKYQPYWYRIIRTVGEINRVIRVEYQDRVQSLPISQSKDRDLHMLQITNLQKNDSGEYMFSLHICEKCKDSDLPGVMLVVTGLKVTMTPSAEVTEGQKVRLTCSTSCPLPNSTIYVWYFNSEPLNLTRTQNKHVVLNPVGIQHAGNYSCAVINSQNIISNTEALTVKARHIIIIVNIMKLAIISLIPLAGFTLFVMMRRKPVTVSAEMKDQTERAYPLYETVKLRVRNPPTHAEQAQEQEDAV